MLDTGRLLSEQRGGGRGEPVNMSIFVTTTTILAICFLAVQVVTCSICGWRCRRRPPCAASPDAPSISLVRPLCGLESHTIQTLAASFRVDYPRFELLFCVVRSDDPVVPLVRKAMASFPSVQARLLIGDDPISDNPKLNNMVKGWREAQFDHIVFADSNLLVPPDYLSRLAATWVGAGTGLVSAPPIGSAVEDFCGELECAFLNSYEARWQYVVDSFGFGFAQGKTLFYKRSLVPGGVQALAGEPAEDAATTKVIRAAGLRIRLARPPFFQPLGKRAFAEVWSRQVRWARLRRVTFPLLFAPEILTSSLLPLLLAAGAAAAQSWPIPQTLLVYGLIWYAAELILCQACGWHVSWRFLFAILARDALIPVLWANALASRDFVWKGQALQAGQGSVSGRPDPPLIRRRAPFRPSARRSDTPRPASATDAKLLFDPFPSAARARARMVSAMRKIRRSDKPFG